MRKAAYAILLAFMICCWIRVYFNRYTYSRVRITVWLCAIGLVGGWCVMALVSK